jgi:hypothetical protein
LEREREREGRIEREKKRERGFKEEGNVCVELIKEQWNASGQPAQFLFSGLIKETRYATLHGMVVMGFICYHYEVLFYHMILVELL